MANQRISVFDGTLTESDIDANERIFSSVEYDRFDSSNSFQAIRIEYHFGQLSLTSGQIEFNGLLEAEGAIAAEYSPVGYTFNAFSQTFAPRTDEIVAYGDINWSDGGVPNGFFFGGLTQAQLSYNPVHVPDNFRVCVSAFC